MKKNQKKSFREWKRFAAAIYLSKKLENNLENDGDNPGNGCSDCANPNQTVPPVHSLEAALVYYHPSFVGYLEAAGQLLKQAFCHKKRKDFILVSRDRPAGSV